MQEVRVGVVGAGSFGTNHLRVLSELDGVTLAGVVDIDISRAADASSRYCCPAFSTHLALMGLADAVVVSTPTATHSRIGCELLSAGMDLLVEKPIAPDLAAAQALTATASRLGRVLQIGHLERFNPAVQTLRRAATLPLFFEIHRMSVFTPRSLDVDVVLDLMIHDIDILLSLTGAMPVEIRAAGIRILSRNVDIANVRLAFPNGCVANLTASRVSVEKIRKLRLFQPREYLSLDYARQDLARISIRNGEADFESLTVDKQEPLRLELESFIDAVRTRKDPVVSGHDATRALEVCLSILDKIEEHGQLVERTMAGLEATVTPVGSS